ncbi:unnamed protein product [Fusarium fujikuroi]|nr:unnamed protein product [Fusarium fujikuroi]
MQERDTSIWEARIVRTATLWTAKVPQLPDVKRVRQCFWSRAYSLPITLTGQGLGQAGLSHGRHSSGQNPDANAHSSLSSSFLLDSTSRTITSTNIAGLLTRHTSPSPEALDEQGPADLPKTLSRYERKLKKFFGQWHASLVKKSISEHLAYGLAKHFLQASDEEGDSGTDSHHNLGAGAQTSKQGLSGGDKPSTLTQNHPEEGHEAFDNVAVAQRLPERDFGGRLSSQEICVIGIALLHEVFGGRGQKRLSDALMHLYGQHPRRHLADLDRNASSVADEIRKGGPATLSSFTLRWAQAIQHDSPNILTIDTEVSLVREWDRWLNPAATGSIRDIETSSLRTE